MMRRNPKPRNHRWSDKRSHRESIESYEARLIRRECLAQPREQASTVEREGRAYRLVVVPPEYGPGIP